MNSMNEESNEQPLCLLANPTPPFYVMLAVPPHHVLILFLFVGFRILSHIDLSNMILSIKDFSFILSSMINVAFAFIFFSSGVESWKLEDGVASSWFQSDEIFCSNDF